MKNSIIFVKNFVLIMSCKKCSRDLELVNKHFKLCRECNNERLYGNKYGKRYDMSKPKRKPLKRARIKSSSKRTSNNIKLDEVFYEECFNMSDHRCEECGAPLPEEFRDDDGKVLARWRYSHIIPKSVAPKLRRDVNNINHLCLKHHMQWENGDKQNMSIYSGNLNRFPKYLKR